MRTAYEELERRFERHSILGNAITALDWDASTYLPHGGASARANETSLLRVMSHDLLTAPDLFELLEKAKAEPLDDWQSANLREMHRLWLREVAVPDRVVEGRSQAMSACEMQWRVARKENDFKGLLPSLEEVLKWTRELGEAVGGALGTSAYDALLDEWEPGALSHDVERVFDEVLSFLPPLVEQVLDAQRRARGGFALSPLTGPFPEDKQLSLARSVMTTMGFDFERGRIDTSAHPFCVGVPSDVRITTRWDETDYLSGLFSVIHETGHALYEQGLPERFKNQPVGQPRGMSTHESQSLLWEMQAARTSEFGALLGRASREAFGVSGAEWSDSALLARVRHVERSMIRVEADEVTYPLHVILRFRLERAMISGDLLLRDLPEAFADGMASLLGVRPRNVSEGCLQDIHWPAGLWGYFPTYTLGAMTAAQLFRAAEEGVPGLMAALGRGETGPLLAWLRTHVHAYGSRFSAEQILVRATGRPLDPQLFRRHLERRYLGIGA